LSALSPVNTIVGSLKPTRPSAHILRAARDFELYASTVICGTMIDFVRKSEAVAGC